MNKKPQKKDFGAKGQKTIKQGDNKKSTYIRQRFPGRADSRYERKDDAYDHVLVQLRRTTKVMAGGKRMRFSALVAVGDRKGKIGLALGKAPDPRSAIEKARKKAKKRMINVRLHANTVPHEMTHSFRAAKVFLKPAREGTGLIAGSSVRMVLELAGVKDAVSKICGSNNKISNAYCVLEMLERFKTPHDLAMQTGRAARKRKTK